MLNTMDLFGGTAHIGDHDLDTLPPVKKDASELELLDYMVLVLSRYMTCSAAFKGGYMLNQLLPITSRLTHDVDFSIAQRGDYEGVKRVLRLICEKFKKDGIITEYRIKSAIEERRSGGVDMYDAEGVKILGVDVGLHNISYGIRHYNLSFTEVDGFEIERMLSDKLIAITTRKRFRRTKDLYDFYAITNFFDVDLAKLSEYVKIRTGVEWDNIPFNDTIILEYKRAWDKLKIESYDPENIIEKPEFEEALGRFYRIALPIKENRMAKLWDHVGRRCANE